MTADHPEDWERSDSREEVRRALQQVEVEASGRDDDDAAAMRDAIDIIETELEL